LGDSNYRASAVPSEEICPSALRAGMGLERF
jgi:hypothetical protein